MEKSRKLIDIESEEKAALLELYKNMKQQLLAELDNVNAKIDEIEGKPKSNVPQIKTAPIALNGVYKVAWNLPDKMSFALHEINKCATLRQIFDKIAEYEPAMRANKEYEYKMFTQMASTVTHKVRTGKIFDRYKPSESADYKIGLIGWFDQPGIPKEEYK